MTNISVNGPQGAVPEDNSDRLPPSEASRVPHFDRPVVLQQSPLWSRIIIWTILGGTALAIIGASVFQIEEAIPATGQLEPTGAVKEIQPPVAGVVREIQVKDGDRVKKGQLLLSLDPTATDSELASLRRIRANLLRQNELYANPTLGGDPAGDVSSRRSKTQDRQALVEDNRLLRAQINGGGGSFSAEERARLQSGQAQKSSTQDSLSARLAGLNEELAAKNIELEQNRIQLESRKETLKLDTEIAKDIKSVFEDGAIAKIQYQRQQDQVQTGIAEVARLQKEEGRLKKEQSQILKRIAQTRAEGTNQSATDTRTLQDRVAANQQNIAAIDSQLSKEAIADDKQVADNKRQIAEIENRLNQARLTMKYQELRAPVDGVVFDLKANAPGFVVQASQPVLKIVPADNLQAKVFITNQDIGFVKKNFDREGDLEVDVRIDSFPFSEFGDVKGTLSSIGSDALPPTEVRPFYSFPAMIDLKSQKLIKNDLNLPLQSGMSVNVNIKVRKRTLMSIFTDQFTKQVDNLKRL
ncbi:MAG: HlyD family efflux transporter periplasmic adaptor subunit [Thermosynechococcaceae cyanobacterium]